MTLNAFFWRELREPAVQPKPKRRSRAKPLAAPRAIDLKPKYSGISLSKTPQANADRTQVIRGTRR